MTELQRDPAAFAIIAAAMEVHRRLGPGLFERVYHRCLLYELLERKLHVEQEFPIPVIYKGVNMDCGFRADFMVDGRVILEVKCVDHLLPIHTAQVLTYLRLSGARQAFLLNFNCPTLKEGLRSFIHSGASPTH